MKELIPYLTPPGLGIFTVSAAKDRKKNLFQAYYNTTNEKAVTKKWKESLNKKTKSNIYYLGIPSDCGGGILRGSNWGPFHLRTYLTKEYQNKSFHDLGDIPVIPHLLHDKYLNKKTIEECRKALYSKSMISKKPPVSPLSITDQVSSLFYKKYFSKKFLFSVGGDHSISYPIVKNFLMAAKKHKKRVAVIHFDAHTDLSAARLGIDYCFGTWAYHILPYLDSPKDLIQLGIRSSGKSKQYWQKKYSIQQFWSQELQLSQLEKVSQKIQRYLEREKIDYLYLSFDIDALDSSIASATGTPEDRGLTLDTSLYLIEKITSQVPLISADLMELAPNIINLDSRTNHSHQAEFKTFSAAKIITDLIFQQCTL